MGKMPPALCQMHSAGGIPVSSDLIFPDEELFVGWHLQRGHSLHLRYRDLITATGISSPLMRIVSAQEQTTSKIMSTIS